METIFEKPWMSVKETETGFTFAERKGVNSIAVCLYRMINDGSYQIMVRYQPMPPVTQGDNNKLFPSPITGSVETYDKDYQETARREILEEAGYDVPYESVKYIGEFISSTQMSEVVYCYVCDVTGKVAQEPEGDGSVYEELSENKWIPLCEIGDVLAKQSPLSSFWIVSKYLEDKIGCCEDEHTEAL